MSKQSDLYSLIIEDYKELKNKFNNGLFKETRWFLFHDGKKEIACGLDMGFNLTIVYKRKNILALKSLIESDNPDFSIYFDYLLIGGITLLNEEGYQTRVLKKRIDNFFETPKKEDLVIVDKAITYLYSILNYELAAIFETNYNAWFCADFNDLTGDYTFDIIPFVMKSMPRLTGGKDITDIALDKSKINDEIVALTLFHIELPIFSKNRNKLTNPAILEISDYANKKRKFYLLDVDEESISEAVLSILMDLDSIPGNIVFENLMLFKAFKKFLTREGIKIYYQNLIFKDYDDFIHLEGNIYNVFRDDIETKGSISFNKLERVIDDLNRLNDYLSDYLDDSNQIDTYLLQTSNKELFDIYNKYCGFDIKDYDIFTSYMLHYQILSYLFEDPDYSNDDQEEEFSFAS